VDGSAELFLKYNEYEAELDKADLRHVCDLYDAEIRTLDDSLRELFKLLEEAGLMESSVIVFTADHGENLGEHHYITHGPPYEAGLHIPLMFHFPGDYGAGKHIDALVENTDTVPTLLEIFNIPAPDGIDGQSLLPLIDDPSGDAKGTRDCLVAVGGVMSDGVREVSVFDGTYRLTVQTTPCLYHITADPHETENVVSRFPDIRNELIKVVELTAEGSGSLETPMRDAETMELLKSLGYFH
jgi:arylsulfatase A-like enzyme